MQGNYSMILKKILLIHRNSEKQSFRIYQSSGLRYFKVETYPRGGREIESIKDQHIMETL